jgi:hypothetical protein
VTLAYLDSFSGLVPCRVVAVGDWSDPGSEARIQFTATRGPWKRGEFETFPLRRVVPRSAVRRRKYSTSIMPYSWVDRGVRKGDENGPPSTR